MWPILRAALLVALAVPSVLGAQAPFAPGDTRSGTMKPGDQQTLVLALDSNACARLELHTELDVSVTLRKPGGATALLMDIAGEEWAPAPFTIIADEPGSYAIELRLPEKADGGDYKVVFFELRPATDRDRQQAAGEADLREGMRLFQQGARESRLAAVELYRKAEETFRALDDKAMLAKSIDKIGQVYNRLGEARLALETYQRALEAYRAFNSRRNEASMLNNVGLELANLGRYADAIEPLTAAAALFREVGDTRTERSPINNLGLVYYQLGEVDKSTAHYERALQIARDHDDESGEAFAYMGLAALSMLKGNLQGVLDAYANAITKFRNLGNHQLEALALSNIGTTYLRFGDGESALTYLFRAQEVRKLAPNRINEANTLGNIATAYTLVGQPQKALDFANQHLRFWRESGNKGSEAMALQTLGLVQLRMGDLAAAAESYEVSRVLGQESRNRQVEAYGFSGLSQVRLRQGAAAEALKLASAALAIARDNGLRLIEEDALVTLARAELLTGALDSARQHAAAAISLAESIRSTVAGPDQRAGFVRENYHGYDLLVDVLMQLHQRRPDEGLDRQAFAVSERARARTLIDLLTEARTNIREGADAGLLAREQALRAQLALRRTDGDDKVQPLVTQYRELQNEIRATSPRYAALVEPPIAELATVQRDLLDSDTAIVEYALGEDRSYVWVVDAASLTAHELPARARIDTLARRAHDALSRQQSPELRPALQELSAAVIAPIASRIAGKRLAIVSEGALQYIPFAALPGADGRPLIASHEMVSLPSASTLLALRAEPSPRRGGSGSVLVVGDPVFDQKDPRVRGAEPQAAAPAAPALERSARDSGVAGLERLWFTRREADSIAALAPPNRVRKLLDFDASLDGVTSGDLSEYRVIHFATHGLLNNKHPELSGLVFSLVDPRGRPRNGFLPAVEVYNLRLNADLVVLSACQTALGEDIRGEGLIGLTRAFMYAGTPRVVASLWRVPDSATAALMQRFYRALLVENRRPADALRVAQESVRAERRWAAPYYWAGFTLAGEWK
jgi:CHAT domain-containing protein/tetratricopeptide (TPR) repeat protein